jgi:hypothetical protein
MNRNEFIEGMDSDISFTNEEREEIIAKSIDRVPWKMKCVVAMEEFSELIQQVSKHIREEGNKMDLLEEIADAYICLNFLESIFYFQTGEVSKAIDVKLNREKGRFEDGKLS